MGDRPNFRGHRGEVVVDENGTVPFAGLAPAAGLKTACFSRSAPYVLAVAESSAFLATVCHCLEQAVADAT